MARIGFITGIAQNVQQGSGCYVGTRNLIQGIRRLGSDVELITPQVHLPFWTATRVLFNETLRWRDLRADATIGIDADGYALPARPNSPPHVACIKGVMGDAVRFESGATRAAMAFHARLEAKNARRADLVITISRYCAERIEALYGVKGAVIVPETIDLGAWRRLFDSVPARHATDNFTVLSVCRFYPRKALDVLLRAAAQLREVIPGLEVRIVGAGPQQGALQRICRELRLEKIVRWLGDLPMKRLAEEYRHADVFCLPSRQEGFGIVFLEAMAAGKAIVAARAAAVPEVVRHGILVDPDNAEALADALLRLHRDAGLRESLAAAGGRHVEQFDVGRVSVAFLSEVAKVAPQAAAGRRRCESIEAELSSQARQEGSLHLLP
jgi:glycosyltransferase involved in cell wall biosynthesis